MTVKMITTTTPPQLKGKLKTESTGNSSSTIVLNRIGLEFGILVHHCHTLLFVFLSLFLCIFREIEQK